MSKTKHPLLRPTSKPANGHAGPNTFKADAEEDAALRLLVQGLGPKQEQIASLAVQVRALEVQRNALCDEVTQAMGKLGDIMNVIRKKRGMTDNGEKLTLDFQTFLLTRGEPAAPAPPAPTPQN